MVGRIRRPHGVHGEFLVEPLTDDPERVFAPGRRVFAVPPDADPAAAGDELHCEHVAPHRDALIVQVRGVDDRDAAERRRDQLLLVPASEVRPPVPGEIWQHQLVGLELEDERLGPIGRVEGLFELPQGLLLEVRHGERTVLVPWRAPLVREVDLAGGRLRMSLPEGLIE